ncbi:MAG: ATP-binding cassette domain-containing protein [Candidatus Kuenenbacteria bacterium]
MKYNLLRSFIIDLGRISVIFYSTYLAWQGNLSLGSLVFFISLSETAYHALFRISRTYDRLIESSTGVQRITSLLSEKTSIKNNPKIKIKGKLMGKIEFKNVSFSYQSQSKTKILKNINITISPGETIALIGPSGGGKSTIVKLLYRHYDVTAGKILVDNNNIRDYDIYKYRSNLAIVPQEVEVFNTSIKENIAYGKARTNLMEIKKAAKAANIDFIEKMENGFETLVGERGVKLSGGQKQRVGIARAIVSNPSILIFDEATSNLDTHSEKQIQSSIANISKNQTMIIIAHRLSTIISADKIFVIDKGRIVESGTHAELLQNKNGIYSHLLELQALGGLK